VGGGSVPTSTDTRNNFRYVIADRKLVLIFLDISYIIKFDSYAWKWDGGRRKACIQKKRWVHGNCWQSNCIVSPPIYAYSVNLRLSHRRTNKQTDLKDTRPIALLSVVSVGGVHHVGGRSAMLHRNLRESWGGVKIRDQPINTLKLVSWLSGKSLKYCHQMSHLRLKCKKSIPGICPFVSLLVCLSVS